MKEIVRNPDVRGGQPMLRGTRMPVGQLIAELAEGGSVEDLCKDYDLDLPQVQAMLREVATMVDQMDSLL